jgi:DinB family protein
MKRITMVLAGLAMFGVGLTAGQGQPPAQSPAPAAVLPTSTAAEVNTMYNNITGFITRSLAMVPADKMTWQPTPDVRTYARLFAHISDDNNAACAAMAGVTPPPARVDAGAAGNWAADKMAKADIEKALSDSIALCQKAFASINQSNMMESAGGRGTRTKIGYLIYNTSHINEHYGNLVTYLRLNGMVPPSSGGK